MGDSRLRDRPFIDKESCCNDDDFISSRSEEDLFTNLFTENTHHCNSQENCVKEIVKETFCEKFEVTNINTEEDTKTEEIEEPDFDPQSKLMWALENNKYELFLDLLKEPEVNPKHKYGKPYFGTCIEIACKLPERSIFVRALLNSGVKPNVQEICPEPIHFAAREGNYDALTVLLQDKRTKLNVLDSFGRTALHHAVRYTKEGRKSDYERCIVLLLKQPELNINVRNNKGYTAIHEAANSSKSAVELILKLRSGDIDLDTFKANGRSAREFIMRKYPDLSLLLPDFRKHIPAVSCQSQLLSAIQHRELKSFCNILRQVDEDGKARVDPNYFYGEPHNATCIEIACREEGCVEFVKELLNAGADPNVVNARTSQTTLHVAVEMGNSEILTVLIKDRRTNINSINGEGKSILHLIVEHDEGMDNKRVMQCLKLILLKPRIQVNLCDKSGLSPVHIALLRGRKKILEFILEHVGTRLDLDSKVLPHSETLRTAIVKKFPDLENKLPHSRNRDSFDLATNLFQLLYDKKCDEFVYNFPNVEEDIKKSNDGNYTFLQYATLHGLKEVVHVLLEHGVDPNATTGYEKRPPIVIASVRKNNEILKLFFSLVPERKIDVNAEDTKGNTALHYASRTGDIDSVVGLMRHGANIQHRNVFDKPPLPPKSVECFLNNSLKPNDKFPEDEEYKLIFDYSFLVAHRSQNVETYPLQEAENALLGDVESNSSKRSPETLTAEMDFLFYISRSKDHRNLMEHPIITSFLHIKWHRVRMAFYINLCIYVLFVLLLNYYILLKVGEDILHENVSISNSVSFNNNSASEVTSMAVTFEYVVIMSVTLILIYFTLREVFQFVLAPGVYIRNTENILDFSLIFFSGYILFWPTWMESFVVITILLSWTELILLTGRLPKLSRNVEMLKTVSRNYFWFLFSYIFLIIAFAFSFYSLLHKKRTLNIAESNTSNNIEKNSDFFTDPFLSITKTFVMMMGEFEASSFLPEMLHFRTCFWLFGLFVFLIAMVLLNLLTGLAVNDTHAIKSKAKQLALISRISLIYEIESTLLQWHRFVESWCAWVLFRPFVNLHRSFLKNIIIFPDTTPCNKRVHVLPNKGPKIIIDRNVTASCCEMDLNIIGSAMVIISNRGKETDICNLKQTFDEMQQTAKQNHEKIYSLNESNLLKIQNKIEENKKLIEAYQKQTESKLSALEVKKTGNSFQELQQKVNVTDEKLAHLDERLIKLESVNKRTNELLGQILHKLPNMNNTSQ